MSHRPIEAKKRRRIAKKLRRQELPARIDLILWLMDHGHASTKRQARDLILAKRVKAESHTIGVSKQLRAKPGLPWAEPVMEEVEAVAEFVDARHRKNIVVLDAL